MITKDDLINWLSEIDKRLNRKLVLVAVGGTALTLLGLKSSTIDIDFCIESKDKEFFKFDKKFRVDLFLDGYIFSEQLPDDYVKKSSKIKTNFKNIDLRALSLIDIIVTKAARYNARDEEDIASIIKLSEIKKEELEERYKEVRESFAGNTNDYDYNFDIILKRHFREIFK